MKATKMRKVGQFLGLRSISIGKNQTFFVLAVATLLALPLLAGCYPRTAKRELPPPVAMVAEAKKQEVRLYKDYTGKTEANESVSIPARVQGFLEKMTFTPGQIVHKNDPLFIIEQTQYAAAVRRIKAQVEVAKAEVEYTKADYERTVELYNTKALTLDDVQRTSRNYQQALGALETAEAELIDAELQFSYTEVNAPINGQISRNLIDIGNLVGSPTAGVETLATIKNMDPIYVYFQISDSDFLDFLDYYGAPKLIMHPGTAPDEAMKAAKSETNAKPGEDPHVLPVQNPDDENANAAPTEAGLPQQGDVAAELAVGEVKPWPFVAQLVRQENDPTKSGSGQTAGNIKAEYPYQGEIHYIDNTINPDVGAITVRGEIANPEYKIFPGWVCHIKVPAATLPDATVVYERAIGIDLSNHYMFVVDKDNKVERRIVTKGPAIDGEFCVVIDGIEPGEKYVVDGLQKMQVGKPVNAKPFAPQKKPQAEKAPEHQKPETPLKRPTAEDAFVPLPDAAKEPEAA